MYFILRTLLIFCAFLVYSLLWKILFFFCSCYHLLWRRRNSHFDVNIRRISSYIVLSKKETDGEVFNSRQSWNFSFIDNMMKVLFPICTLTWRVNSYVSPQVKGINRRNESTIITIWNCSFLVICWNFTSLTVCYCWNSFPHNRAGRHFIIK